ncbi:hypothetical protein QFC21_004978 [Naganishia friedmannii]|uniref:Uncharacterized protein n=1 Tax=Naganishia friedmannii TaxID=89922 RepID=A0ACC2VDR8_9TREE|nr:hypothetical protein QFC21_004978 [Naganishia friedmannii]
MADGAPCDVADNFGVVYVKARLQEFPPEKRDAMKAELNFQLWATELERRSWGQNMTVKQWGNVVEAFFKRQKPEEAIGGGEQEEKPASNNGTPGKSPSILGSDDNEKSALQPSGTSRTTQHHLGDVSTRTRPPSTS